MTSKEKLFISAYNTVLVTSCNIVFWYAKGQSLTLKANNNASEIMVSKILSYLWKEDVSQLSFSCSKYIKKLETRGPKIAYLRIIGPNSSEYSLVSCEIKKLQLCQNCHITSSVEVLFFFETLLKNNLLSTLTKT